MMMKNIRICPKCKAESVVMDSRVSPTGFVIRRRVCQNCNIRWTSAEIPYKAALALYEAMDGLQKMEYFKGFPTKGSKTR